jgi:hypothetical protein
LFGGNDRDMLRGGEGNDRLFGDAGNDDLDGGSGDDRGEGGSGADTLLGGPGTDTLLGGDDNDVLAGGPDPDFLYGDAGTDVLRGEAGIDELFGGPDRDELYGGADGDRLLGDDGPDILFGDEGSDHLEGGADNDRLEGGADNDTLIGGTGDDVLLGGAGVDTLEGNAGLNTVDAGNDGDVVITRGGTDRILTGSGADVVRLVNEPFGIALVEDFNIATDRVAFVGFGDSLTWRTMRVAEEVRDGATWLVLEPIGFADRRRIELKNVTLGQLPQLTTEGIGPSAPQGVRLTGATVLENQAQPVVVGQLSALDADPNDTFTYQVVGSDDFDIANVDQLRAIRPLSFSRTNPVENRRTVIIIVTDRAGLSFDQAVFVDVIGTNAAPTALSFSATSVRDTTLAGVTIGTFRTDDPDVNDNHVYALVAGAGDTDNVAFRIEGDRLVTAIDLSARPRSSYSVRVATTDAGGLSFQGSFTLTVSATNLPPVLAPFDDASVPAGAAVGTIVARAKATDPNAGQSITYAITGGNTGNAFGIHPTTGEISVVTSAALDFATRPVFFLQIEARDNGSPVLNDLEPLIVRVTNPPPVAGPSTRLVVPLYQYPTFGPGRTSLTGWWNDILTLSTPENPITVVVNPSNGPLDPAGGSSQYVDYQEAMRLLRTDPSIRILGNLDVGYGWSHFGAPTLATVDTLLGYYASGYKALNGTSLIDGIFVNRFFADPSPTGYFVNLRDRIKNLTGLAGNFIMANPGTISPIYGLESFRDPKPLADAFIVYTDRPTPSSLGTPLFEQVKRPVGASPSVEFGAIVHGLPVDSLRTTLETAAVNGLDYIFLTDRQQNEALGLQPYGQPPTYFATLSEELLRPVIVDQTLLLPENSPGGTVVGTISAFDPKPGVDSLQYTLEGGTGLSRFSINASTGQLVVASPTPTLDFEAVREFTLLVRVNDQRSPARTDTATIRVRLTDVNESPRLAVGQTLSALADIAPATGAVAVAQFSVEDDALIAPATGAVAVAQFSVEDDALGGNGITLSGPDAALFEVVGGQVLLRAGTSLSATTTPVLNVTVTVSDSESGQAALFGAAPSASAEAAGPQNFALQILVTETNLAPTAVGLDRTTLQENLSSNAIAALLVGMDPNSTDTLSYRLVRGPGDDDNGLFTILNNELRSNIPVDFEVQGAISIRVAAVDGSGLAIETPLLLTVTDVNEAPLLDASGNPFAVLGAGSRQSTEMKQGTLVSDILARGAGGNPISDPDTGALRGIALTAVDQSLGNFQYTLVTNNPAETDWINVDTAGAISDASALLLPTTARIRFTTGRIPHHASAPQFLALESKLDAGITFRAWDQTSGVAGGRGNTSNNGGSSAFSLATETAKVYFEARLFRSFNTNAGLNIYTLEAEFNALTANPAIVDRSTSAFTGFTILMSAVPELGTAPLYRSYFGVQFNGDGTETDMGYRYLTTDVNEAAGLENLGPANKRPTREGAYFRELGVNNNTAILGYIYATQQPGTAQMTQVYRTDNVGKPTRPPGTVEGSTPTSTRQQEQGDHVYTTNTAFETSRPGTWRVEAARGFVRELTPSPTGGPPPAVAMAVAETAGDTSGEARRRMAGFAEWPVVVDAADGDAVDRGEVFKLVATGSGGVPTVGGGLGAVAVVEEVRDGEVEVVEAFEAPSVGWCDDAFADLDLVAACGLGV